MISNHCEFPFSSIHKIGRLFLFILNKKQKKSKKTRRGTTSTLINLCLHLRQIFRVGRCLIISSFTRKHEIFSLKPLLRRMYFSFIKGTL